MSHYLLLNNWMGADQGEATEKMAKVFRMSNEEASPILDLLANGNPWQFEYQVSDQQTEVARNYLQDLGFDVEAIPAIAKGGAPAPMADEMPSAPKEKGGGLKGLMATLGGLFSRKKKEPLPEADMDMDPDPYMEASMEYERDMESDPYLEAERDMESTLDTSVEPEQDEDMDLESEPDIEPEPDDDEFRDDRR